MLVNNNYYVGGAFSLHVTSEVLSAGGYILVSIFRND